MPHGNFFPLPDGRQGGGYGTLAGHAGESSGGDLWPYFEPVEDVDDLDDELDDDRQALAKKKDGYQPSDHLGQANYKPHAYVKSATRGLTGIMASIEPQDILEVLAGAIGQASPSYNVSGPDGTTRTRPGRRTGSKRGYFSPHPPKDDDPDLKADTLRDVADNQEDRDVKHSDIVRDKVQKKNLSLGVKEVSLRAYIRNVLETNSGA